MKPLADRPVVVLGPHGMLGQMAIRYFNAAGYMVIALNQRFSPATRNNFIDKLLQYPNAVIINCIGKIKQKTNSIHELIWANCVLPLELARRMLPGQTLVHPSTDCVFSGTKGSPYLSNDLHDATDEYGWAKQMAEVALAGRKNTLIIRVSVVGTDNNAHPYGLLGWFLSQKPGARLRGYTNHLWNGITTLEWCRLAQQHFEEAVQADRPIVLQGGTQEAITKYGMLVLFREFFARDYTIAPYETEAAVDRRLVPDVASKPFKTQLEEMKAFSRKMEQTP